jgi:hypothetical protein
MLQNKKFNRLSSKLIFSPFFKKISNVAGVNSNFGEDSPNESKGIYILQATNFSKHEHLKYIKNKFFTNKREHFSALCQIKDRFS